MDARAPLATAGAAPAGIRQLWLGDALGPRPPGPRPACPTGPPNPLEPLILLCFIR